MMRTARKGDEGAIRAARLRREDVSGDSAYKCGRFLGWGIIRGAIFIGYFIFPFPEEDPIDETSFQVWIAGLVLIANESRGFSP